MITEPMLPHTFDFEWDGMDERGARTVNVWCTDCDERVAGLDASEATDWARDHDEGHQASCPWCDWVGRSDGAAAHMRPHIGATYTDRGSPAFVQQMREAGRGHLGGPL